MANQPPKNQKRSVSIYRRILTALSIVVVLDALILLIALQVEGVLPKLNQNQFDVFQKQVDTRQTYLQTQMTDKWMDLDSLANSINNRAAYLQRIGKLDLEALDSKPSACAGLVNDVMDRLISVLYSSQVSGIYITFNTHDLNEDIANGTYHDKTGVYIRDNDPLSVSSEQYADLLLECAPIPVVQSLNLSTDSNWEQNFKFSNTRPYGDWLTVPYQAAVSHLSSASDCGYWSVRTDNTGMHALSYSIPLILPDNTVYGVLGVDMLSPYLNVLMPSAELDAKGVYGFLMTDNVTEGSVHNGFIYSPNERQGPFPFLEKIALERSDTGGYRTNRGTTKYEVALSRLYIYNRNAPFEHQRWYVIGAVPSRNLYSFTSQFRTALILTSVLMLTLGFACALIASWRIARPVVQLRKELDDTKREAIPHLSDTGITEVDDFSRAITFLSRDVIDSSRRFLSIMEMSSIEMGGYEVDAKSGFLFVTDNFFNLLGHPEISIDELNAAAFRQHFAEITASVTVEAADNGTIYVIPDTDDTPRYIHVQETRTGTHTIGVAEDVTAQVLERKRIEHERDFDILTGIYNRRAFYRRATQILEKPDQLGVAVVIMIDLDNLKVINDTYGHEWGDRYIMAGARCIREHCAQSAVFARVSGDEFNLLIYGFRNRGEAIESVEKLQRRFSEASFQMPDGTVRPIGASGGIVFVGDETCDLQLLLKFADFAMYLVKHKQKGFFGYFDPSLFHASEVEQIKHNAFKRIVRDEAVRYAFQPIVDARTGEIHAVEALMRIHDPDVSNVGEFLRIARLEDMLDEVERLTWFHALPAFRSLLENGILSPKTRVFINSQVSQLLGEADQQLLIQRFADIRDNTVMEVVETDDYSVELSNLHQHVQELYARDLALDDFGTGYNNEKNLLELMPQYVKLDMSLIRDVHKHTNHQILIRNLIGFAHQKNMIMLAEGVETAEELRCLLDLNVDMLQGYFLARPAEIPAPINPDAIAIIREHAAK